MSHAAWCHEESYFPHGTAALRKCRLTGRPRIHAAPFVSQSPVGQRDEGCRPAAQPFSPQTAEQLEAAEDACADAERRERRSVRNGGRRAVFAFADGQSAGEDDDSEDGMSPPALTVKSASPLGRVQPSLPPLAASPVPPASVRDVDVAVRSSARQGIQISPPVASGASPFATGSCIGGVSISSSNAGGASPRRTPTGAAAHPQLLSSGPSDALELADLQEMQVWDGTGIRSLGLAATIGGVGGGIIGSISAEPSSARSSARRNIMRSMPAEELWLDEATTAANGSARMSPRAERYVAKGACAGSFTAHSPDTPSTHSLFRSSPSAGPATMRQAASTSSLPGQMSSLAMQATAGAAGVTNRYLNNEFGALLNQAFSEPLGGFDASPVPGRRLGSSQPQWATSSGALWESDNA